jgi:hypothetical protein
MIPQPFFYQLVISSDAVGQHQAREWAVGDAVGVPSRSKLLETIRLKSSFFRIQVFTFGPLCGRGHYIRMGV